MTIPVIPGPFSFLARAGEAAGQIGQALEARKQKKRDEARQLLQDMLVLAGQGADVPLPAFMESAKNAGIPLEPAGAAQLFDHAKRRARALLTTTEAGGRQATNQADITGAQAGVAPQMAAVGLRTAEAGATTAEAGAQAAPAMAQSDVAQAKLKKDIFDNAVIMLGDPKNETLRRIATYSAVGGLPFLIQQMETNRMLSTELRNDARLLMQAMQQVQQTYTAAEKEWMQGVTMEAFKQNIDLASSEGQKFIDAYEAAGFPRPDRAVIQEDVLGQFGMTTESFKGAAKTVFPRVFGQPVAAPPGTGAAAPGATPAPPGAPGGAQTDPIQRAADMLVENPTKEVAHRFVEAFKAGAMTRMQARAVLAKARRSGKVPEAILRAIEIEIPDN